MIPFLNAEEVRGDDIQKYRIYPEYVSLKRKEKLEACIQATLLMWFDYVHRKMKPFSKYFINRLHASHNLKMLVIKMLMILKEGVNSALAVFQGKKCLPICFWNSVSGKNQCQERIEKLISKTINDFVLLSSY